MSEPQNNSWTSTTFGAIVKRLVNGGTPPTEVEAFWRGDIPWVTGADFTTHGIDEFRRFVSHDAVSQTATNVIGKGELLLVTRTGVGKLAIAPCDIAISQDITGVYPDTDQVDVVFLYHRMQQGVEDLKKLNQGTSIKGIVRKDLLTYPLELPPIPQQGRIAEILSTVDEAIEQTEALIAKTQQIKAGLMHDLFTRGVTPDGKLRPPRDEAPESYKESPLGWIPKEWRTDEIGILFGRRVERGRLGLPIMAITMTDGLVPRDSVDRRVDSNLGPEKHLLVRRGDIAYNMMRMWQGVLGRASYDCLVSPAYVVMTPAPSIDSKFAEGLLSKPESIANFKKLSYGVVDDRLRLYPRDLERVRLAVPTDLREQCMIAERLEAVGETLCHLTNELGKFRQLKLGLMHDLLAGRVRVSTAEVTEPKQVGTNV